MIEYVLDASVAAKWYLPPRDETLVEESLHLLDAFTTGQARFLVPGLFWPEMGNILWKAAGRKRISRESAAAALRLMQELRIATHPCQPLLSDAFAIASKYQCTVYDSMYAALAVATQRPLITADERLANTLAGHFPVRWLGAAA
jgi:predicted nucleic acid-binding protein